MWHYNCLCTLKGQYETAEFYSLITQWPGITLVTVETGDVAVVANVARGVDNSRLIAWTLYARIGRGSSNSVTIVTDLTLLTVVTCSRYHDNN